MVFSVYIYCRVRLCFLFLWQRNGVVAAVDVSTFALVIIVTFVWRPLNKKPWICWCNCIHLCLEYDHLIFAFMIFPIFTVHKSLYTLARLLTISYECDVFALTLFHSSNSTVLHIFSFDVWNIVVIVMRWNCVHMYTLNARSKASERCKV